MEAKPHTVSASRRHTAFLRITLAMCAAALSAPCQEQAPVCKIVALRGADPKFGSLTFLVGNTPKLTTTFSEEKPIPAGVYSGVSATLTQTKKEPAFFVPRVPERNGIFVRRGKGPQDSAGSLVVSSGALDTMWKLAGSGKFNENITLEVKAPPSGAVAAKFCVATATPGVRPIIALIAGLSGSSITSDVHGLDEGCRVETTAQQDTVFLHLHGDTAFRATRAARQINRLLDNDNTRPLALIGHSMGGETAIEICTKLWENHKRRVDLVLSIDPVDIGGSASNPEGMPGAFVQFLPSKSFGPSTPLKDALTFLIPETSHTTVDAAHPTRVLLAHFVTKLPKNGINSWGNVCSPDYRPVQLPKTLEDLPAEIRAATFGVSIAAPK
jgi:pimeloyl-ACP methyl ester carboxylesterase